MPAFTRELEHLCTWLQFKKEEAALREAGTVLLGEFKGRVRELYPRGPMKLWESL